MLSRRAWFGIAVYLGVCGWICYRAIAGYPEMGGLLARIGG